MGLSNLCPQRGLWRRIWRRSERRHGAGRIDITGWNSSARLSKKRCGPGSPFDLPLGHKDAAKVRSHFDGIEVRIPDAPRADEIVVAVGLTDSGRPLPRVGGLRKEDVKGEDGLN